MKETGFIARVRTLFKEVFYEQETRADRMTLTLLEAPSGSTWNVKVEGAKPFSLFSDELVINFGPKRPAIKFTSEGMITVCPKCGGKVRYGVQCDLPNWWCEACGHHKISKISDIAHGLAS